MKLSKQEKEMVKRWRDKFSIRGRVKSGEYDDDQNTSFMAGEIMDREKKQESFLLKEVRKAEKRGREREAKKYGDFVVLMNEILLEENNPKLSHLKSLINNK